MVGHIKSWLLSLLSSTKSNSVVNEIRGADISAPRFSRDKIMRKEISTCFVVKNEAKYIIRAIKSVLPFSNEIVLIDTGSSDGTPEIVEKFMTSINCRSMLEIDRAGDRFHVDGVFHFGNAKDYSLKFASCDYVMWMDGSEYVENPTAVLEAFNASYAKTGGMFVLSMLTRLGNMTWPRHRLFPKKYSKFEGAVHETPVFVGDLTPIDTDIIITHEVKSTRASSLPRNLAILLKDWEENKSSRNAFYLGCTYYDMAKYDLAYEYYLIRINNYDRKEFYDETVKAYENACECLVKLRRKKELYSLVKEFNDFAPKHRQPAYYAAKYHELNGDRVKYSANMVIFNSREKQPSVMWNDKGF